MGLDLNLYDITLIYAITINWSEGDPQDQVSKQLPAHHRLLRPQLVELAEGEARGEQGLLQEVQLGLQVRQVGRGA